MPDFMEIAFVPTRADVRAVVWHALFGSKRAWLFLLPPAFPVAQAVSALSIGVPLHTLRTLPAFGLAVVLLYVVLAILLEVLVRRAKLGPPLTVRLEEGGLHYNETHYPWSQCQSVTRARSRLYLRMGPGPLQIPRRAFPSQAAFLAFADRVDAFRQGVAAAGSGPGE